MFILQRLIAFPLILYLRSFFCSSIFCRIVFPHWSGPLLRLLCFLVLVIKSIDAQDMALFSAAPQLSNFYLRITLLVMLLAVFKSVFPVLRNGSSLQQLVHVWDLALAVVKPSESLAIFDRLFNISSTSNLPFSDAVRFNVDVLDRLVQRFHILHRPLFASFAIFQRFGVALPINAEQLPRLNENEFFLDAEVVAVFAHSPILFEQGSWKEVTFLLPGIDGVTRRW